MTLRLRYDYPRWCCKYCGEPVGVLGNWLAKWFGTQFHGCDFSNVLHEKLIVEYRKLVPLLQKAEERALGREKDAFAERDTALAELAAMRERIKIADHAMQLASSALKIKMGALSMLSPCAADECRQDHIEWRDAAEKTATEALAAIAAAQRNGS